MAENQYMQPFFDSLSQGVQVAQGLRQAALQQQQMQEAQREFNARQTLSQQEFGLQSQLDKANMIGQGATPVSDDGNVNVPALQPSSIVGPNGQQTPTLANTGQTASVPADTSKPTVSVGGSTLQVPTAQDRDNRQLQSAQALNRVGKLPVTQAMSDATGGVVPVGSYIDPSHAAFIYQTIKANAQAQKSPLPERAGWTTDGRPITFQRDDDGSFQYKVGDKIPGAETQSAAPRQLTPFEQVQINRQKKQDADEAEYNGVLSDVLSRASGDPAQAKKLVTADAAQSKDNAARRQLPSVLKQLNSLQGRPDETQAMMQWLNSNTSSSGGSAANSSTQEPVPLPGQAPPAGQRSSAPATQSPNPASGGAAGSQNPGTKSVTTAELSSYAKSRGISYSNAYLEAKSKGYKIVNIVPGH